MARTHDEGSGYAPSPVMISRGQAFGAWFRLALQMRGVNVNVLSQQMGVSRQLLYAYRNDCMGADGRYRRPSEAMIRKIAEAASASADDGLRCMGYLGSVDPGAGGVPRELSALPPAAQQLLARAVEMIARPDMLQVPVLSTAAAGASLEHLEIAEERVGIMRSALPSDIPANALFAVRVRGYCLRFAFIADGDYLICRRANVARDRDIVVVVTQEGDALAKRYRADGSRRWLETDDGGPASVVLEGEARIVGVVISRTGAPK